MDFTIWLWKLLITLMKDIKAFKRYFNIKVLTWWNHFETILLKLCILELLRFYIYSVYKHVYLAESLWLFWPVKIIKDNLLKYLLEFIESFENPCFVEQDDFLWCMHICTRLRVFTMQFMHFLICIDFC